MTDSDLPTQLNIETQGPFLKVGKDKLSVRYTGEGKHTSDVGAIQVDKPVPLKKLIYYFEITVRNSGAYGRIAIGFTPREFKNCKHPGWEAGSFGYHGDDGKKFHASGSGEAYGPPFSQGDTVGAGFHLGRQHIFFTKNGTMLDIAFKNISANGLYPTVGMHSENEEIELNLGQQPFKFDLEGLVAEEKQAQKLEVDRMVVPPGVQHQLVRDYLVHYGFAHTLVAFERAASGEDAAGRGGPGGGLGRGSGRGAGAAAAEAKLANLDLRKRVREQIMRGQVEAAMKELEEQLQVQRSWSRGGGKAETFAAGTAADSLHSLLRFNLHLQSFVEQVRCGRILEAVQYGQAHLASYLSDSLPAEHRELLHAAWSLLAYEQPEASPFGWLLELQQREMVADVVNAALLHFALPSPPPPRPVPAFLDDAMEEDGMDLLLPGSDGNGCGSGAGSREGSEFGGRGLTLKALPGATSQAAASAARFPLPQSALEQLLKQTVVVHDVLLDVNNSQGEMFNLQDHMVPHPGSRKY